MSPIGLGGGGVAALVSDSLIPGSSATDVACRGGADAGLVRRREVNPRSRSRISSVQSIDSASVGRVGDRIRCSLGRNGPLSQRFPFEQLDFLFDQARDAVLGHIHMADGHTECFRDFTDRPFLEHIEIKHLVLLDRHAPQRPDN